MLRIEPCLEVLEAVAPLVDRRQQPQQQRDLRCAGD